MTYFHADASVLTPDADGNLPDVTGFVRAWTFADDTALIEADDVTGGTPTQLRDDGQLVSNEKPSANQSRELKGLDRMIANTVETARIIRGLYEDENGNLPAPAQAIMDDLIAMRNRMQTRRDNVDANHSWPSDSVRRVCYDRGEDPDRLKRNR